MIKTLNRKKRILIIRNVISIWDYISVDSGCFHDLPKNKRRTKKIDNDIKILGTLNAGIKNLYAGSANYTGLSVDAVIKAKLVPEDLVDEGRYGIAGTLTSHRTLL